MEALGQPGFGILLRQYRLEAAITQQELAERARISVEAVSTLERGARRRPQRQTIDLLATALDLAPAQHDALLEAAGATRPKPRMRVVRSEEPGPILVSADKPWLMPDAMRTRYFIGRERVLMRLREQLEERGTAALSGLGGVGKTQIALEYAARRRAAYPGGGFWVNGETGDSLAAGFAEIAHALHLVPSDMSNQERILRATIAWLNRTDGWLLILDNVEDRSKVASFVPERDKGHLLITSREAVFQELGIACAINVPDFDEDEAVRFLLTRTGRDHRDSEEDATATEHAAAIELASELGNLPLALEQAAAYITETGAAFADYSASFRKRRVDLLERSRSQIQRETVAVTWKANFVAIERASPAAAEVLRISAFLAADAIPFELFTSGAATLGDSIAAAITEPGDALAFGEVLRPLMRFSLIRSNIQARTFSIHRLVQEIARASLDESEQQRHIELAAAALDLSFPEPEFPTWRQCDRLLPHAIAILDALQNDTALFTAGNLAHRCAAYLYYRGKYCEAEGLAKRALAIREKVLGPEHRDVVRSLKRLATIYWKQGRYAEAEALHIRALAISEKTLGAEHTEVANSLSGLAVVYADQARWNEAEPLHTRALAIREKTLGPEHPHVAYSLHNLAVARREQGRSEEVESLQKRALAIWERALGPEHPVVASGLTNLAITYADQERWSEAEPLHIRALAIREKALGSEHPDLAFGLTNLAIVYMGQGRSDEAEALHKRALAILEKAFGPEHHDVAASLENLANLYREQGRYDEAGPLYNSVLAICEKALGPEHPDVAVALTEVAKLYEDQGRSQDVELLYVRVLGIREKALGRDHPKTKTAREVLEVVRSRRSTDGT